MHPAADPDPKAAGLPLRWLPLLVLFIGLFTTAVSTYLLARSEADKDHARFINAVQQRRDDIRDRMSTQIAMLRGVAGYLAANKHVERDEFRLYVRSLDLDKNYPGILGIGFSRRVRAAEREAFEAEQGRSFPGFHIWPAAPRAEEYHSIVYLEPLDARNRAAIGFDMYTQQVRQAAMARARDTGEPALSGRVTLVQEIDEHKQAGFIIYVPIYQGGVDPQMPEARRERLLGFAYSPLRAGDLFPGIFGSETQRLVDFEIYDGASVQPEHLLYRFDAAGGARGHRPTTATEQLEVAGRTWTITYRSRAALHEASSAALVPWLALAGVAASLLLAGLSLLQVRAQAAQRASSRALQEYREAVYREEKLYRLAVEQVEDYAIYLITPDGHMGSWNRGVEKVLGWSEEEFVDRPLAEIFPDPEAQAAVLEELRIARERHVSRNERWQRRKDGTCFWKSGITNALTDEQGNFIGYLRVTRDLTESRRQQEAIAAHEQQLRLITEALPVLISYVGADQRYRFVNQCYERWFDRPSAAFVNRTMSEVLGEAAYAVSRPYIERALAGETVHYTARLPYQHGGAREASVTYSPDLGPDGKVRGFAVMVEDITLRKQMEERAHNILESITEAFYALDHEGRFTYLNDRAVSYFGRSREALIGQSIYEVVPTARGTKFESEPRRAMSEQTPVSFVERSAFSGRWLEMRCYPSPGGLSVYFRDITDQKRTEDERARHAQTLALLVELSQAITPLADSEAIIAAALRLLGERMDVDRCAYAEIDADGQGFRLTGDHVRGVPSIVGHYALEPFGPELLEHMRTGQPYVVDDVDACTDVPETLSALRALAIQALILVPLLKSGRVVAAIAVHQKRPRAWTGQDVELVTIVANRCWDAVERARAARALRESEARFRAVVETVAECVKIVAPDGQIAYVNRAGVDMLQTRDFDIRGADVLGFIAPEYRADWMARHARVCAGETQHWQFEIQGRHGARRWVETLAVPIRMDDGRTGHLGVTRDVTERKRAEREREALLTAERTAREEAERVVRMKDEFLATLSHELRTPLSAMLGWAQLMRRRELNAAEKAAGLEAIERNAKAQQQLIDDLLDMSRIVSGKARLDIQRVELTTLIDAALEVVQPMADAKHIALRKTVEAGVPPINGDPNRLQQVLWNLLSNAVKFTPAGGSVAIELRHADDGVDLRVRDTGVGIAAEFLDQVFDRFRQFDSSSTRRHGGLGLGLAIVKSLVELHGGSVSAESAGAGQGATFTVHLPSTKSSHTHTLGASRRVAAILPHAPDEPAGPDLEGATVLIVDDDADARAMLRRMLLDFHARVLLAGSAEDGLRCVREARPALIVSDIGMPEVDGYGFIRRVRDLPEEQGGRTPAIALTAFARAEDRQRALLAGFQRHVAKPVDALELAAICVELLQGKARKRA